MRFARDNSCFFFVSISFTVPVFGSHFAYSSTTPPAMQEKITQNTAFLQISTTFSAKIPRKHSASPGDCHLFLELEHRRASGSIAVCSNTDLRQVITVGHDESRCSGVFAARMASDPPSAAGCLLDLSPFFGQGGKAPVPSSPPCPCRHGSAAQCRHRSSYQRRAGFRAPA